LFLSVVCAHLVRVYLLVDSVFHAFLEEEIEAVDDRGVWGGSKLAGRGRGGRFHWAGGGVRHQALNGRKNVGTNGRIVELLLGRGAEKGLAVARRLVGVLVRSVLEEDVGREVSGAVGILHDLGLGIGVGRIIKRELHSGGAQVDSNETLARVDGRGGRGGGGLILISDYSKVQKLLLVLFFLKLHSSNCLERVAD